MIIDAFTRYYGTDVIGWAVIVLATYFLAHQNRIGFLCGLISNISLIIFGFLSYSIATIVINVVLAGLNIKGYFFWKKNC